MRSAEKIRYMFGKTRATGARNGVKNEYNGNNRLWLIDFGSFSR